MNDLVTNKLPSTKNLTALSAVAHFYTHSHDPWHAVIRSLNDVSVSLFHFTIENVSVKQRRTATTAHWPFERMIDLGVEVNIVAVVSELSVVKMVLLSQQLFAAGACFCICRSPWPFMRHLQKISTAICNNLIAGNLPLRRLTENEYNFGGVQWSRYGNVCLVLIEPVLEHEHDLGDSCQSMLA